MNSTATSGFNKLIGETFNGRLRDEELALHHPTFGGFSAASVACHFVRGVMFGPTPQLYPCFDYVIWLLSNASGWMPQRFREFLITGMKEWATWYWTESREYLEDELGMETNYPGRGDFADALFGHKVRTSGGVREAARADLLERIRISAKVLGLLDSPEALAQRFLSEQFVEAYIRKRSARVSKDRRRAPRKTTITTPANRGAIS